MKELTAFAHAVADATRWRIVQLLFNEPLCVCELADILKMPQSSVSSHVQVLRKAGLLDSEKCEKWVYYRVRENHRRLLVNLGESFQASAASDTILRGDAKRAEQRLAKRDNGCCPLPKDLGKLNPLGATASTKTKL